MYEQWALSRLRIVSADSSSHKGTVACDGFLAYLVPNRMQRRDLKPFSFCSKIRRDRHKFISFAVFSECTKLHEASWPNVLIFIRRLPNALIFVRRFRRQVFVKPNTVNRRFPLPRSPNALIVIWRALLSEIRMHRRNLHFQHCLAILMGHFTNNRIIPWLRKNKIRKKYVKWPYLC